MLHLITSIKHPRNCVNPEIVSGLLESGLRHICQAGGEEASVHVVVNELPRKLLQHRTLTYHLCGLPAPVSRAADLVQNTGAIRGDRGQKYLQVLKSIHPRANDRFMFFDYDDLISSRLIARAMRSTTSLVVSSGYLLDSRRIWWCNGWAATDFTKTS